MTPGDTGPPLASQRFAGDAEDAADLGNVLDRAHHVDREGSFKEDDERVPRIRASLGRS